MPVAGIPSAGERYGRFHLRHELSRDADGAVFEAYDPEVRDLVALHVREDGAGGTLFGVTPLGPAAPAPEPTVAVPLATHEVPEEPLERRRTVLLVALIAAVLALVLGGAVAVTRLVGGGTEPTADAAAPSTEATPSPTAVAPATAAPPPPGPTSTFTCWDGQVRSAAAECGAPSGQPGVDWLYPGAAKEDCALKPDSTPGRQTLVECRFRGGDAVALISLWNSADRAVRYFADRQGLGRPVVAAAPGDAQYLGWVGEEAGSGLRYRAASLTTPYGYSVFIKARSAELRDRLVFARSLAARPADQYLGVPG